MCCEFSALFGTALRTSANIWRAYGACGEGSAEHRSQDRPHMQGDAGLPDISRQDPHTGGKPGATTARVGLVRWLQRVSSFLRAWKFKLETRSYFKTLRKTMMKQAI